MSEAVQLSDDNPTGTRRGRFKIPLLNPVLVYVIRRFIVLIPLWFGISIVTFVLMRISGDPRDLVIGTGRSRQAILDAITQQYQLDKPWPYQYNAWIKGFLTWDFGYSGTFKEYHPGDIVNKLIELTAKLQYLAIFLAILIAIPLGITAAKYRGKTTDVFVSTVALLGLSMPIYLTGYLLIANFAGSIHIFPVGGAYTANRQNMNFDSFFDRQLFYLRDDLWHLTLPLIALTFFQLALITRLIRSSMLEVLGQDYILAARANGISERKIIWKHALRNAIIPTITFIAISLGTALAGAPITETVFNWPGLGRYFIIALNGKDMAITLGITMIITTLILLSNLVADILYVYIDPRLRYR